MKKTYFVSGDFYPRDGRKREISDLIYETIIYDHDLTDQEARDQVIKEADIFFKKSRFFIHYGSKYYFGDDSYDPAFKWIEDYQFPEGRFEPRKVYDQEEFDRALGVANLCMMF